MSKIAPPFPPPGFDDLSSEENLDYLHTLWDRIASRPDEVPVPAWHLEVIEERLAEQAMSPGAGLPLEEAIAKARGSLKESRARRR